jgi:colanic acid/amylovoran biosynthesis glycosyltransferase
VKKSVAYLVNQYPKVSHTFIRREIRALERLGATVHRFSIRSTLEPTSDPDDIEERAKTRVVLMAPVTEIGRSVSLAMLTHPVRFARALALTTRIGLRSDRGLLRHVAYLVEACLLRDWLGALDCHHLHAHFGTNPATVAMLCRELGGPTWSFTAHGPEEFDRAELIALSDKIRRASFVVAISSYGRSQLLRFATANDWKKIHVVRCGLDQAYLGADRSPVPHEPRLVCVGRLSAQKGHPVLVEAAAELARRGVEFELVLVGDGELRETIEAQVVALGLEGRIRITGWMDGDGVRRAIASARVLVLPSFAEGLPVVLMEALAMGRPVVSTYVAGIPELVESGKNGWLVPAGSALHLAQALQTALGTDVALLDAMGEHGRIRVREAHDAARSAESLVSLMIAEGG